MKEILVEVTASTNEAVKEYLGGGEDVVFRARRQTGGKGTKGRSFLSDEGGVYLSVLRFYEHLAAEDAFRVMAHAAVAVCKTAEKFGVEAAIKWPNDVYSGGKKLCGILVENILSGEWVRASIVGIGLNVQNDVSPLGGIATSLSLLGSGATAEEAAKVLIGEYFSPTTFEEYRARSLLVGKRVLIEERDRRYFAEVVRVAEDGRLEVEEGGRKLLSAAEVVRIGGEE